MSRETLNARNNVTFLPIRLFLHRHCSSDTRITGLGRNVAARAPRESEHGGFTNDDDASMSMSMALVLCSGSNEQQRWLRSRGRKRLPSPFEKGTRLVSFGSSPRVV